MWVFYKPTPCACHFAGLDALVQEYRSNEKHQVLSFIVALWFNATTFEILCLMPMLSGTAAGMWAFDKPTPCACHFVGLDALVLRACALPSL